MLGMLTQGVWPEAMHQALNYRGPERRTGSELCTRMLALVLDEIDYGLMLVSDTQQVLHINHAARAEINGEHPLQLVGRELRATLAKDVLPLSEALAGASERGLRRMLTVGDGAQRLGVSVVPLRSRGSQGMVLLVLGKPQVSGTLSVQGFARSHGLSPGEEQVLRSLCNGASPQQIAATKGVKIATVRTQIAHIRAKTGAESIRDLVHQVALLPPMVGVLQRLS